MLVATRWSHHAGERQLICADGGGSNGSRVRAWKIELAKFAADAGPAGHRLPPTTRHQQMEQNRVFRHKCGSADGCDGRLALGGNGVGLRCLAC